MCKLKLNIWVQYCVNKFAVNSFFLLLISLGRGLGFELLVYGKLAKCLVSQ